MRLKKLKLVGFKSFVDPTNVIFPSNLVAVVGPNGCGKSNIIDAVRWVMGEGSAKNLRGESMVDVIFNGSSQRKPVGQASVEMVFDNSAGTLLGEYASYTEIAIKRMVTRDGQSNYYLNGTKCRKKDIGDIFLGTGLGPRSYAIIGQGTISRLIEAKPEELRTYLEEAAGISKYKERRRETETRISHTRENLERLNDIRDELASQLEKLQRQAAAAVKYKEFREQERLLKAQNHALRWRALHQQLELQQQKINQHNLNLEAEIASLRSLDNQLEGLKNQQQAATEVFNHSQAGFYRIGAEIARLEEAVQHQQQRRQQLEQDLLQAHTELSLAQQHTASDSAEITQLQQQVMQLQPQLSAVTGQHEDLQRQLAIAELSRQQWQQEWDNFNANAAESSKVAHVAQTKIQHLEQSINSQLLRIEKLQQEQASLDDQPALAKVNQLQQQQLQLSEQHATLTQNLQAQITTITAQRDRNTQLSRELDDAKQQLQQLHGTLTSLEALQHVALGNHNEVISGWLQQQQLTHHPRLAQEIVVESGWETAVETVLGDYLQAICLDNFNSLEEMLASFIEGNLALIDLSCTPRSAATVQTSSLVEKVTCNVSQINSLLHGIHAAANLSEACALLPQLHDHQSIITRDGLWLGKGWVRVAKERDPKSGILQRAQQIKQLQQQITEQQNKLALCDDNYQQGIQQLQQYEQARDSLGQQVSTTHQELADCGARLRVAQAGLSQMQQRVATVVDELAEQQQLLEDAQHQLYEIKDEWQQAMQAMQHDADKREQLINSREQTNHHLEQLRQQVRQQREMSHELAVKFNTSQSQLAAAQQNLSRSQERINALTARHQSLAAAVAQAQQPDVDTAGQLQQKLADHALAETELKNCRQQVESITHQLRTLETTRLNTEDQSRHLQAKLDQLRLDGQTLTVKCATLEEALAETEFSLEQLLQELPETADLTSWDERLQAVANKIQQLGAVNLAAIDEYATEAQRKQYLDSQYQDLTQALDTLENAIAKIDRETRQRFKQTYDQVNQSFQQLFPRLFGGGQAYLELTGEDLLNTGVTVMARPPGKRNSSIYLLSGGEKAMTAVALVFAIFQLTPSPFCMLDEVDAPLDDANVSRFCALVREMSSQVQFIFVTHNKVAMELATHLSGVTMHEPGVSRMVSVDIDEAISLAEA